MIKYKDEYLVVQTKYDPIVLRIIESTNEVCREIGDIWGDNLFYTQDYILYREEKLLDGLSINHYRRTK